MARLRFFTLLGPPLVVGLAAALVHCSSEEVGEVAPDAGVEAGDPLPDSGAAPIDPQQIDEDGGPPASDSATPAPMPDAGPNAPDAAAFYGAPRCATANVVLCDAFEGATIDATKWMQEKNGANTIALDTQHHARGQKSVRFHMVGTGTFQYAWLGDTKVFPQLKDHLFGRIFYMLEKVPTKAMHWTTIEAGGQLPGKTYGARMRYGGEYDNFIANYTTTQGQESAVRSKTPFPIATWSCFEWEYERATNTVRFWIDEVPLADVSVTNAVWVQPPYDKVNLGWQNYQANAAAPMNVWMDEVALDGARIGCVK